MSDLLVPGNMGTWPDVRDRLNRLLRAVILRPDKTPGGAEIALVLRHVVKAIRAGWPRVEILIRGDSHYARP